MILWLVLFVLVIAISFVLAFRSMHDYQESPKHSHVEYGLYLIRNTQGLTTYILDLIHGRAVKKGILISLERLFRGGKSALVIYGPKSILIDFIEKLNLLELEDYTAIDKEQMQAWEVGARKPILAEEEILNIDNFFKNFPLLSDTEQFWWQLVLHPNHKKEKKYFTGQIRAVVYCEDLGRRKKLSDALQNLSPKHFMKVPKPFTSGQILEFYQMRVLDKSETNPSLTPDEVLKLSLLN